MPRSPLSWGFLGTAGITKALLDPIRKSRRNQILAIASRSKDRAVEYAHMNKIRRAYGSYDDLLSDPDIDVIYNSLPNHLHAEWTIKALQAGKHVLCEKPLALTLSEVGAISAASEKYGKVVTEAFMYRSHLQTLKAREIVKEGRLGKIKMIRGSFTFMMTDKDDYRWNPEMGGGGLWDIGCYPLSYTRFLLGVEPREVFGWQVTGPTGVDEQFIAQLRFPGDVYAQFDCSIKIPYHNFMEIVGEEATLIIPKPFTPGLKETLFITRDGKTESFMIKGNELYIGEVEGMADAILLGDPPPISLADSRANTATILALFESAKTGLSVIPIT